MEKPGTEWYWAYWALDYFGLPLESFAALSRKAMLAYIGAIRVKSEMLKKKKPNRKR